jgi:hypothetical protein
MTSREAAVASAREPVVVSRPKRHQPTNDEIAARAYEIFLHRGGAHGSDLEDWLQAEQELKERS